MKEIKLDETTLPPPGELIRFRISKSRIEKDRNIQKNRRVFYEGHRIAEQEVIRTIGGDYHLRTDVESWSFIKGKRQLSKQIIFKGEDGTDAQLVLSISILKR